MPGKFEYLIEKSSPISTNRMEKFSPISTNSHSPHLRGCGVMRTLRSGKSEIRTLNVSPVLTIRTLPYRFISLHLQFWIGDSPPSPPTGERVLPMGVVRNVINKAA